MVLCTGNHIYEFVGIISTESSMTHTHTQTHAMRQFQRALRKDQNPVVTHEIYHPSICTGPLKMERWGIQQSYLHTQFSIFHGHSSAFSIHVAIGLVMAIETAGELK